MIFTPNNTYQKEFIDKVLDPQNRIIAWMSGRKMGKTYGGMGALLFLIYQTDRCKHGEGWVVSLDHPESRAAQMIFQKVFGWKKAGGRIIKHLKSENSYLLYMGLEKDNKTHKPYYRVSFKSSVNYESFRGFAADFLLFDEAAYITEEAFRETLPVLNTTGGPIILSTTPKRHNWVYDLWLQSLENEKIKFVRGGSSYDNPYADKGYIDLLKTQMSAELYRQEIEGEFISSEGLVYPFDSKKHVFDHNIEIPDGEVLAGIDFGFHPDPFVYIWVKKCRKKGGGYRYFVMDEIYKTKMGIDELVPIVRLNPLEKQTWGRYADPSSNDQRDYMARYGMPTWMAKNDWQYGYGLVAAYMERGDLYISDKCKNGIEELQNYEWNKKNDKPKTHQRDHFCDALRYVIASEESRNTDTQNNFSICQEDGSILLVNAQGETTRATADNINPEDREAQIQWMLEEKQRKAIMEQEDANARAIAQARARWQRPEADIEEEGPTTDRWGQQI